MQRRTEAGASWDKAALLRQVTKQVFVLGVAFVENDTLGTLQRSKDIFDPFIITPYFKISVMSRKITQQKEKEQQPCPVLPVVLQLSELDQASLLHYRLIFNFSPSALPPTLKNLALMELDSYLRHTNGTYGSIL